MEKREIIQLLFVIGLYLAIIVLLVSVIVLVKNINLLKQEPVEYAISKTELNFCRCYTEDGTQAVYGEENDTFKENMVIQDWTG